MGHLRITGLMAGLGIATVCLGACGDGGQGTASSDTVPGSAMGSRTYPDASGDVPFGQPDLTALTISNGATTVRMRFTFAGAPPLASNVAEGWTDMLLMGIDVPPIGAGPTPSGWMGLDYALGMHGVDTRAVFRAMREEGPRVRTLTSRVAGRTISLDLPRALIGDPAYFAFNVAVGREGGNEVGGGDSIPPAGTLRYRMARALR